MWKWLICAIFLSYYVANIESFDVALKVHDITNGDSGEVYRLIEPDNPDSTYSTGKYTITKKAINVNTTQEIALKFEIWDDSDMTEADFAADFCFEKKLYDDLKPIDAITNHYYCGFYDVKQRIAVTALEWTDKTLDQLRNNKRFHLKTVLQLAIQLINKIEEVHKKEFVLANSEPSIIGRDPREPSNIQFLDLDQAEHYPDLYNAYYLQSRVQSAAPPKYMSLFTHQNGYVLPENELESFAYMLMEFLHGKLPWSDIQDEEAIYSKKQELTIDSFGDYEWPLAYMLNCSRHHRHGDPIPYEEIRNATHWLLESFGWHASDEIDYTTHDLPFQKYEKPITVDVNGDIHDHYSLFHDGKNEIPNTVNLNPLNVERTDSVDENSNPIAASTTSSVNPEKDTDHITETKTNPLTEDLNGKTTASSSVASEDKSNPNVPSKIDNSDKKCLKKDAPSAVAENDDGSNDNENQIAASATSTISSVNAAKDTDHISGTQSSPPSEDPNAKTAASSSVASVDKTNPNVPSEIDNSDKKYSPQNAPSAVVENDYGSDDNENQQKPAINTDSAKKVEPTNSGLDN